MNKGRKKRKNTRRPPRPWKGKRFRQEQGLRRHQPGTAQSLEPMAREKGLG